jgi:hypothetical protein
MSIRRSKSLLGSSNLGYNLKNDDSSGTCSTFSLKM